MLGLLIGSAGVGAAAMGAKAWQQLSLDYKGGYVAGFLAMGRLARNLQPGGYIDTRYPDISKAKPVEWVAVIDELYEDPENQGYTINSIMQSAARRLEEKYGPALSPHERTRQRLERQLNAVRENLEAKTETAPSGQKKATVKAPPKEVEAAPAEPGKALPDPWKKKKQKKWCRCDGTDFREARRKRRAAAAAAEAEEKAASGSSPE